ncbi:MAG: type II toxin-antitoxin system RelE/ParE family toxin [Thaumarchaeota archaeon]|nr:type II toxin-antitoxin system RelE/ParE family toxin [Nitrososphaerota archaeon]
MKVSLSRKAQQFLDHSNPPTRNRLEAKMAELVNTPYTSGCKKVKGLPNSYRLRVGTYRILYTITKPDQIVIFRISPRESAYDLL